MYIFVLNSRGKLLAISKISAVLFDIRQFGTKSCFTVILIHNLCGPCLPLKLTIVWIPQIKYSCMQLWLVHLYYQLERKALPKVNNTKSWSWIVVFNRTNKSNLPGSKKNICSSIKDFFWYVSSSRPKTLFATEQCQPWSHISQLRTSVG